VNSDSDQQRPAAGLIPLTGVTANDPVTTAAGWSFIALGA